MKTDVIGLPLPKTNVQEVLYTIIEKGSVSFFDMAYMQGFRTRVSELVNRHGLVLSTTRHSRFNKFGNSYVYHIHKLPRKEGKRDPEQYKKAIALYYKLHGN